jgi:hypothetical protein
MRDRSLPTKRSSLAALIALLLVATALQVPIRLTEPSTRSVMVNVHGEPATASYGLDFYPLENEGTDEEPPAPEGEVQIPAGQTAAYVTFVIVGDTVDELDETFNVVIDSAIGAAHSHTPGVVTILDDDAPTFLFGGFSAPVDNAPVVNVANAGRSVPVKYQLTNTDGTPVTDPSSYAGLTSAKVACGTFDDDGTDSLESYSGSSGLQYLGDGYWQINWATPRSYTGTSNGPCRVLKLELSDGSTHQANFRFK